MKKAFYFIADTDAGIDVTLFETEDGLLFHMKNFLEAAMPDRDGRSINHHAVCGMLHSKLIKDAFMLWCAKCAGPNRYIFGEKEVKS